MRPTASTSRQRIILSAFSVVLAVFVRIGPVDAVNWDSPQNRASLKAYQVGTDAQKAGLTISQLQTDVEVQLRKAGITVVPASEGQLHVSVWDMKRDSDPAIRFHISIEFVQSVKLDRAANLLVPAVTWSMNGFAETSDVRQVRLILSDLVNSFINAYLEQNPKK
jgi:hypothetical protein